MEAVGSCAWSRGGLGVRRRGIPGRVNRGEPPVKEKTGIRIFAAYGGKGGDLVVIKPVVSAWLVRVGHY